MDLIFYRNTAYSNQHAPELSLVRHVPKKGLVGHEIMAMILNAYVSTRNILKHLAYPGTYFVTELAAVNDEGRVLQIPGAQIVKTNDVDPEYKFTNTDDLENIGTGIYRIKDPLRMAQQGIGYFLKNLDDKGASEKERADTAIKVSRCS